MKRRLGLCLLLAAATAHGEPRCELAGKVEHWLADACMWEAGTDDFASTKVQACIARTDRELRGYKPCTQRRILKERICRAWTGPSEKAVRSCLRDPNKTGMTVKNGGL